MYRQLASPSCTSERASERRPPTAELCVVARKRRRHRPAASRRGHAALSAGPAPQSAMVGCRPAAAALLLLLVLGPAPHAVVASAASRTAGTHDGADNTSTNSNNNKYSSVTAAVYSDQSCSGTPTEVQKYPIGVCFVNAVSTKILNCSDDGSSFLEGAYHDANCTDADSAPYRTNTSTCLREGNKGVRWLCNLGAAGGGAWAEAELGATVDADATASARRPGPASQEGARRHHPHGGGDTEGTGAPVESEKRSAAPEAPRTEIGGGELRYAAPNSDRDEVLLARACRPAEICTAP
jgi:hypothetical protein